MKSLAKKFEKSFVLGFVLLAMLIINGRAAAYSVEPMIKTIEPQGNGSIMKLTITNTDSSALALELTGLRVTTDESGVVSRQEEYEDLMIFPMQTSIPPGRSQVVQVRYVGDQNLEVGRVYAVKVEQLPVAIGSKASGDVTSQVKIGLSFFSHILVQAQTAEPELIISSIEQSADEGLDFTIENIGQGTALLKEMRWTVFDEDNKTKAVAIESLDTGTFGAQIPSAPKRIMKIKPGALEGLGKIEKVTAVALR